MSQSPNAPHLPILSYRKPTLGRDYWVIDEALPNADEVRARLLQRTDWYEGYPRKPEGWPGMRTMPALESHELEGIEAQVRKATGATRLWITDSHSDALLNHNCVQVVGYKECESRPHTDSRLLCRYAAVLFLNPNVPDNCGTSFYRQRMGNGQLGGNIVQPPHATLVEALGTRYVSYDAFVEDIAIPHKYNRLLIYRANLIHAATNYWGTTLEKKRMAAVFFWMAS